MPYSGYTRWDFERTLAPAELVRVVDSIKAETLRNVPAPMSPI